MERALKTEVDRMLADSKASRFIDDFVAAVAATAPRGHVPAGQETLSDLRRVAGGQPALASLWSFSARCSHKNLPIEGFHRFRLDHGQRAALRLLRTPLPETKTEGFQRVSLKPETSSRRSADDGRGRLD